MSVPRDLEDGLASIVEAFQRPPSIGNGALPSSMHMFTVKSHLPQLMYVQGSMVCSSAVEFGTNIPSELPQSLQQDLDDAGASSFTRQESLDVSDLNSRAVDAETSIDDIMTESPLQKLIMLIDDEMDRSSTFEQREIDRRESEGSPTLPLQAILANLPDVKFDPEPNLLPSLRPVSSPSEIMSTSPTSTVPNSTLPTMSKSSKFASFSPFTLKPASTFPFNPPSTLRKKRRDRRFSLRQLVRKIFPLNSVINTPAQEMESMSRWSCSTGYESDWKGVSQPASPVEDRGYF